jgi:transposase InsO family protein
MEFIIGLPKTKRQHDGIMEVVDKLSKVAHFIPTISTYKSIDVVDVFIKEISILHGMPKNIILDQDAKFTSNLWKDIFGGFRIKLAFNTNYHPYTNGKIERENHVLEDMLRIHVMHQPKKWEYYLCLVGFAYNNGYQESLKSSHLRLCMEENVGSQSIGIIR